MCTQVGLAVLTITFYGVFLKYKTMHLYEYLHTKGKLLDQEMYFFKIRT